jgi:DNA-binding transcriptional MocR family regulator
MHLARSVAALSEQCNLGLLTHESVPRGTEADRIAGGRWLARRFGEPLPAARVMVTNGTQSAILILLRRLVGHDGLLVAERLSYGPLRLLAQIAGVRVHGLDIDADGVVPDAFEAACRSLRPRALYLNPTVQNPTTAVMPTQRRADIADIARRYEVAIIEDDALGGLHLDAPKPIAALAPDCTWYVMTTTKCLSHGLRLAYLVAPSPAEADRVIGPVEHLSYWHPAPLLAAMVRHWIDTGVADQIAQSIRAECVAREAAAREILAGLQMESKPGSMHIWLRLPEHWSSREFMSVAERHGVLLRSSELFAVDEQPTPNAARLSLSTPHSLEAVRRGLERVRVIAEQSGSHGSF